SGGEADRHEMPLGHLGERSEYAGRRLVQRLERRAAPDAVVHARPAPAERVGESVAIEAAHPAYVPRSVVLLGPLAFEHRLGPAVADLLAPIRAHRVAAVVPDNGGGVEAQRPAPLLQSPAHVHVVAGDAKLG